MLSSEIFRLRDQDDLTNMRPFRADVLLEKTLASSIFGLEAVELEKKLRFKTIERFGGKKGDLSRAVEEAVKHGSPKKNRCARRPLPLQDFQTL